MFTNLALSATNNNTQLNTEQSQVCHTHNIFLHTIISTEHLPVVHVVFFLVDCRRSRSAVYVAPLPLWSIVRHCRCLALQLVEVVVDVGACIDVGLLRNRWSVAAFSTAVGVPLLSSVAESRCRRLALQLVEMVVDVGACINVRQLRSCRRKVVPR